ncbi:MAG: hypothetical protein KDD35_04455 [Bdellovibrionales bacterium]|nr:hypothetical protein [Bdellovibrionales bacterium]
MSKYFTLVTIFTGLFTFVATASAMDVKLGQHVQVIDSAAINSTPAMQDTIFLVLKGAELFGGDQVMLTFETFFTEEDKKDLRYLKSEVQTYKVIMNKVDSLGQIPGIRLINQ